MILDKIVARELSTTTLQTRPAPSAPDRRRAPVKCSQSAALGKGSVVMRALPSPGGVRAMSAAALAMPALQKAPTPTPSIQCDGIAGRTGCALHLQRRP